MHQGVVAKAQITKTADRIAAVVVQHTTGDTLYTPMAGYLDTAMAGKAATDWTHLTAALTVIDGIMVNAPHHMRQSDLSGVFWNEVDMVLPNNRKRKKWSSCAG